MSSLSDAPLVEGKPVAEQARHVLDLLQLELELDPGEPAIVEHDEAEMREAGLRVAAEGERRA